VQPALGTLALYTFVTAWNEFIWPTLVLRNFNMWTLQQGLGSLNGTFGVNWTLLSAATVFSMVPIVIVFLFLQRFFLEDYAAGAIKG
jgi:ABC-type glycerol-3-phosphate transport system permease component